MLSTHLVCITLSSHILATCSCSSLQQLLAGLGSPMQRVIGNVCGIRFPSLTLPCKRYLCCANNMPSKRNKVAYSAQPSSASHFLLTALTGDAQRRLSTTKAPANQACAGRPLSIAAMARASVVDGNAPQSWACCRSRRDVGPGILERESVCVCVGGGGGLLIPETTLLCKCKRLAQRAGLLLQYALCSQTLPSQDVLLPLSHPYSCT